MSTFIYLFLFVFSLNSYAADSIRSGKSMNPDLSLNALMLYQNSNRGNEPTSDPQNGFALQEAEIQMTADVDPYSRFLAVLSLHPEYDKTTMPYSTEYKLEPEEVYAETLSVPYLTVKAGKFKTAFGRHNTMHTHAFPFIDAPLIQTRLLGDEGLNDVGGSISGLIPLPWFSELTFQAVSGKSEGLTQFKSQVPGAFVGVAHWKNLWELSDETTLDIGGSGASGKNTFDSSTTIYGIDTTLKWRPVIFGASRAIIWSTELMNRDLNRAGSRERGRGLVTSLQYQLASRWWIQGRAEHLAIRDDDTALPMAENKRKQSVLVGFVPSEFSSLRAQYDHLNDDSQKVEHKLSLQLNFSIGAHPAHTY